MQNNLDMDCLRAFVASIEHGGFARAGARIGRSISAVSFLIDKLEKQVGTALLHKQGSRMTPTAAGQRMLDHARAILAATDTPHVPRDAERLSGRVTIGVVGDVFEGTFRSKLAEFAARYRNVSLEVLVDHTQNLVNRVALGRLDQALAFDLRMHSAPEPLYIEPMVWIGARHRLLSDRRPLPLVLLDEPCPFRASAMAALAQAGIPCRVVLVSPSLAVIRAVTAAGLGITVRTPSFACSHEDRLMTLSGLPKLPHVWLKHYRRRERMTPAAERLAALCVARLRRA